jgi:hypothetical protein
MADMFAGGSGSNRQTNARTSRASSGVRRASSGQQHRPFLSKALIPFANRRKTASIPRRTVDDPETSGFEQDLPGSPPPWKSRHLRLCSEDKVKRIFLQISLGISGLLMLFRFGGPALFWGATGPGPFGNRWLTEGGTATLLLDADLRFFGAMMIGVGFVFFWAILKVKEEVLGALIYILAYAVAIGAASRIYARITYGNPGTAGTIPIAIEGVIPILLIVLRYYVGKDISRR